jgi:hypothetical protein
MRARLFAAAERYLHCDLSALTDRDMPTPVEGVPVMSTDRLDLAAVWQALPEERRGRIGEMALGIMAGGYISALAEETALSASRAAFRVYEDSLEDLCSEEEMPEALLAALKGPSWRIPSRIGPVCLSCGCSDGDACVHGCSWTDRTQIICTACEEDRPLVPPPPGPSLDEDVPY